MNAIKTGLLLFLLSASSVVHAYIPHGWQWGDDPVKKADLKKEASVDFEQLTPDEQVAVLHASTMSALHTLDLDPTPEHAKMAAQWLDFWSNKATGVVQAYRQMLLENPDLDYHLKHPTEAAALAVTKQINETKRKQAIQTLSQHYGIFYFYEGASPYEKALSPILQHFSNSYQIDVIPVSVDGVSDPVFVNGRMDTGQAKTLGVTHFPALLLVDAKTHAVQPLSYGFITEDLLVERFYQVATHFKGDNDA